MSATETKITLPAIEETIFDTPSGNVRGIVIAMIHHRKKTVRIAHATLTTDSEPKISLTIPNNVDLQKTVEIAEILDQFVTTVSKHDAARAGRK